MTSSSNSKHDETAGLLDEKLCPIPKTDVDYMNLPLSPSPEEYFLLSRITGQVTIGEICQISGLSKDATLRALTRLQEAGLIEIPGPKPQSAAESGMYGSAVAGGFGAESVVAPAGQAPAAQQPVQQAPAARPAPRVEITGTSELDPKKPLRMEEGLEPGFFDGWPERFGGYAFDEAALAEDVEIGPERRRHILFIHDQLEHIDYYQMIGVSHDAARKDIRASYFNLSKIFHPDAFYGKRLGSYAERIDEIFHFLNRAHQVLSHKKKRADYDSAQQLGAASSAGEQLGAQASSSPQYEAQALEADAKKREAAFAVLVKRAEKHEAAGDYVLAAEEYRKAFAVKHDGRVALRGANLLMRSGEEHLDEAILLAKAAAREEPESSKPLILIGDAYEEKGAWDKARAYYEKARELDPQNKIVARRLKYLESVAR